MFETTKIPLPGSGPEGLEAMIEQRFGCPVKLVQMWFVSAYVGENYRRLNVHEFLGTDATAYYVVMPWRGCGLASPWLCKRSEAVPDPESAAMQAGLVQAQTGEQLHDRGSGTP